MLWLRDRPESPGPRRFMRLTRVSEGRSIGESRLTGAAPLRPHWFKGCLGSSSNPQQGIDGPFKGQNKAPGTKLKLFRPLLGLSQALRGG